MKEQIRLYKKLALILVPVIILAIFFEVKARNLQNGYTIKKNLLEKNIENINILILGSSHGFFSIDPDIVNNKSFNLANYSQDLYYDYMLFDLYKSRMKNIKCIVLSLSYFSFWYDLNDTPEKWRKYFYKEYFHINPKSPLSFSDYIDLKNYSFAFFYRLDNTLFGTMNPELFTFGGRQNSSGWNVDTTGFAMDSTEISVLKGKERVDFTNSLINKDNYDFNIMIIDELIKYSNENNIKLVFVTTPVSYPYSFYMDKNHYNEFQNKISDYVNNVNVYYLNYFSDKRFTMRDYYDYDHLNGKGAIKFSLILKDTIESLKILK